MPRSILDAHRHDILHLHSNYALNMGYGVSEVYGIFGQNAWKETLITRSGVELKDKYSRKMVRSDDSSATNRELCVNCFNYHLSKKEVL